MFGQVIGVVVSWIDDDRDGRAIAGIGFAIPVNNMDTDIKEDSNKLAGIPTLTPCANEDVLDRSRQQHPFIYIHLFIVMTPIVIMVNTDSTGQASSISVCVVSIADTPGLTRNGRISNGHLQGAGYSASWSIVSSSG